MAAITNADAPSFFVASHCLIRLSAPGCLDYAIILGRIMPSHGRDGRDYGIIRTGIMPLSARLGSWRRADGNAWQASRGPATLYLSFGCCARARVPQRFMSSNRVHHQRAAAIDSCLLKLFTASHSCVS